MTKPIRGSVAVCLLALLASACSNSEPEAVDKVRDPSNDVAFTDCADTCSGTLNGAEYDILLPDTWNGTLLLYSHGYRSASPQPPDFNPVTTSAEPAPGYSSGETALAEALLAKGYALAGSGYASNGWAVEDGVQAANDLYGLFKDSVGVPNRVYVWGDSLGGLITQEIAERHPEWVDGAAPLCGVHAGLVPNMNLGLDLATGIQALIDPAFTTHGYSSIDEANAAWSSAAKALVDAAADVQGGGTAKVLALGALVDAAPQTKTYDASTIESRVRGTVEAVLTGLGFSTFGRYDVEQRYGGGISDNTETDYAARFSAADTQLIDSVGGAGATADIVAKLAAAPRVSADAAAEAKAEELGGAPSGTIEVPTITLHTAADPLVLVQNQSELKASVTTPTDQLVQLFTVPPATFPQTPGAPYGAGHCNFTPASRLGMVTLLDDWVRRGIYPTTGRAQEVFGEGTGLQPLFEPAPWPTQDTAGQ